MRHENGKNAEGGEMGIKGVGYPQAMIENHANNHPRNPEEKGDNGKGKAYPISPIMHFGIGQIIFHTDLFLGYSKAFLSFCFRSCEFGRWREGH
jgi:hypothetical protein